MSFPASFMGFKRKHLCVDVYSTCDYISFLVHPGAVALKSCKRLQQQILAIWQHHTSQAGFIYGFYMLSLVRLAFRVHHVCRIFLLLCVSLQLGVTALSTVWLLELMQSQCGRVRYPASLISARADLIRLLQSKHTAASALEVCPERSALSAKTFEH